MKLLITGAGGQFGEAFKDALTAHPSYEAVFADRSQLDISDRKAVKAYFSEKSFDAIINAAAYTDVDGAESNQELAIKVNHQGPWNLSIAADKNKTPLIQISTDYVFDGRSNEPYLEGKRPSHPCGVYGNSKAAGEAPVLRYSHGLVIRTSWLYSFSGNNFVRTMLSLFKEKDEVRVVDDQIGCPTSAWSLSRAIICMLPQLDSKITWGPQRNPDDRIFHWRDAGVASWYDLACAVQRYYQLDFAWASRGCSITKCRIKPVSTSEYPTAAQRPRYSVLSVDKIQKTFGIEPRHWQDELAAVLECGLEMLCY